MAKYFLATIVFLLFGFLLMPLSVSAASNTVQFSEDTNVYLWGIPLTLVVSSGGAVAEMQVNSDNVVFSMQSGSSVTISSNNRRTLTNTAGVQTTCGDTSSQITLTSTQTETITVTPSAVCGGGGGGGGAVVSAPAPAVEEPAVEEEVVEEVPTETVSGTGTMTASAGGTLEATTAQGGKAKLTMPVNAVTADTQATITPKETTAGDVTDKVAKTPSGRSIIGGYVYDFSAESDGVAVTIFEDSVTVTFTYTDSQVSGFDEDSLAIYYYDETLGQWLSLNTTVDSANNTASADTAHFTLFTLIGETVEEEVVEEEEEEVIPISEMTIAELKVEIARIAALIAGLQAQLAELLGELTADLSYDDSGDDVELLQTWLAKDAEVYPEAIVSGWFGPLTQAAVIRFQEKYADDVLTSWGLTSGTGFVGSTTRAKLNELYGGE